MDDEKKTSSAPDSAASSMAYMPQPKGVVKEDNDFKLDKRAEKKTVADLPDKLVADGEKHSGSGFQVKVNGKPKPEPEMKAAAKPQSNGVSAEPTKLTAHAHKSKDDLAEMKEDNLPVSHTPARRGGKGALILALVLMIATVGLGYLYYASRSQVSKLNDDLKQANSDKETLKAQVNASSTTEPTSSTLVGDSASKRSIPELGLTYKLTSDTNKVTYTYSETQDKDGTVHSLVKFSSTSLIAAERKIVTDGGYKCQASDAPLGILTSHKGNEQVISAPGTFAESKPDNQSIFKFGDTYYQFDTSGGACNTDKTVQALQLSDLKIVKTLLSTLAVQ